MKRKFINPFLILSSLFILQASCSSGGSGNEAASKESGDTAASISVTSELLDKGRDLYRMNCVPCHGAEGRGDGPSAGHLDPKPRDHTDRTYMDTLTDQQIAQIVNYGGAIRGMPQMPSSPHLQGEDLAALIAHVRSLSGGAVAEVQLEMVKK